MFAFAIRSCEGMMSSISNIACISSMSKPSTNQVDDHHKTDTADSETANQLSLFPNHRIHSVPIQQVAPKRRPISLPRSILIIPPCERLHRYLSRVAAAAMNAATKSYGSAALAALRLGTADSEDPEPLTATPTARPKLALAAPVQQSHKRVNS